MEKLLGLAFLAFATLSAACSSTPQCTTNCENIDMAGVDSANVDSTVVPPDFTGLDLTGVDLTTPPDLTAPICTVLEFGALGSTEETRVATAVPTAQGGTVLAGTYHLTSRILYTGPGGATGGTGKFYRELIKISGFVDNSADFESLSQEGSNTPNKVGGLIHFSGSEVSIEPLCPTEEEGFTLGYTVSGSNLSIIHGNDKTVDTYTKQ